jgi:acyl-CoA thioester hydrolase
LLNKTPFKIRVIYADTDAMGIVYHTNYIRWFEVGRSELFRDMGVVYADVKTLGFNFPVTQAYCHYHLPARYDDLVAIETKVAYLKRASIKFNYVIRDESGQEILAEGYTIHACMDSSGKITRIPALIEEKILFFFPKQ